MMIKLVNFVFLLSNALAVTNNAQFQCYNEGSQCSILHLVEVFTRYNPRVPRDLPGKTEMAYRQPVYCYLRVNSEVAT